MPAVSQHQRTAGELDGLYLLGSGKHAIALTVGKRSSLFGKL